MAGQEPESTNQLLTLLAHASQTNLDVNSIKQKITNRVAEKEALAKKEAAAKAAKELCVQQIYHFIDLLICIFFTISNISTAYI